MVSILLWSLYVAVEQSIGSPWRTLLLLACVLFLTLSVTFVLIARRPEVA